MTRNEQKIIKGKYDIRIWVDNDTHRGYFEHQHYGEDLGGVLWFSKKTLIDYDGVYALPADVIAGIRELGFVVPKAFE